MKTREVGIEAIGVAIPRRYLAIEDLAVARGVEPSKFTVGLGAREMAVADPSEDTVALAATAASRLLAANEVDVAQIGMLVVGTETGVDHSKPVASFVQGLLGLPRGMRTFDTQHACYGGTAALMAACDWIASGNARGKSAVVICSDIARYGLNTAGEPTQGGAAVALLVSDRPALFALDQGTSGVFSTDVHDFWRPHGRREALVDGHYSIACYLDAVAGAYRAWRGHANLTAYDLAAVVYHAPFCKMARKAHAHVRRCELEDRALPLEDAGLAESYERQVAAGLELASRVGNTYTGSLYLGLASLLHTRGHAVAGQRIGMFSYGSGCSSEFFSGVVGPRAGELVARAGIDALLAARVRIDVAEYERIMTAPGEGPLAGAADPAAFRFLGVQDDRRTYATLLAK